MSIRTRAAFRRLMQCAAVAESELNITPERALSKHIKARFLKIAVANRRKRLPQKQLNAQLQIVDNYCTVLRLALDSRPLQSMLQALASGVGSFHYVREIEDGLLAFAEFEQRREARHETDEETTSERQNRVMLHALLAYAEKLAILHEDLPSAELTNKLASKKASVSITCISHNTEEVVVEVDEDLSKQTIYIKCQPYDYSSSVERLEITEPSELRGVIFHAHWYRIARRLFDVITEETPVHKSRATTIVGHGVGGAVALAVSLLMLSVSYEMRNVVTFGAPKLLESCLERHTFALSPIRVASVGDPLVPLPSTGAEGNFFTHIGEILLLEQPSGQTMESVSSAPPFSMQHYCDLMHNPDVRLSYAEGDEIWESEPAVLSLTPK